MLVNVIVNMYACKGYLVLAMPTEGMSAWHVDRTMRACTEDSQSYVPTLKYCTELSWMKDQTTAVLSQDC